MAFVPFSVSSSPSSTCLTGVIGCDRALPTRTVLFSAPAASDSVFPSSSAHRVSCTSALRLWWLVIATSRGRYLGTTIGSKCCSPSSSSISSGVTMGPPSAPLNVKTDEVPPSEVELPPLRTELYPAIEPYRTGFLRVSDLHNLYWEENGNPDGQPVVFLHGGPGSGTSSGNRRFFDPEFYRIILFDQRGSGKSTPHASLEENDTWRLAEDIEKLREHLGISKWMVFGGSWGSTLSLFYAQQYPDRVLALVLRGIFLVRKKEIDWFYRGGAAAIFPDAWESYQNFIPEEERSDFVEAYGKRLSGSDPQVQLAAARAWTNWELATSYLVPNEDSLKRGESERFALAFARVENHYFINKGFFPSDSFLLDNIDKIRHLPGIIIQGRYDIVCPIMSAWDLHKAWPEAQFKVVPNAGHSANETGVSAELVAATEYMKRSVAWDV